LNSRELLFVLIFGIIFILTFLSLSEYSIKLLLLGKALELIGLFVSEEKLKRALFILELILSCWPRCNLLSGEISILFNKYPF